MYFQSVTFKFVQNPPMLTSLSHLPCLSKAPMGALCIYAYHLADIQEILAWVSCCV